VYLPDDMKAAVAQEAARRGTSAAEVIRLAIRQFTSPAKRPRRGGVFRGGQAIAAHVDRYLVGFGR